MVSFSSNEEAKFWNGDLGDFWNVRHDHDVGLIALSLPANTRPSLCLALTYGNISTQHVRSLHPQYSYTQFWTCHLHALLPMSGPSVLDYARYYGLATDAGSQNLLGLIKRGTTQENDCVDLPRDLSRPDYDELLRDDKMQVNLGAITVLAECTRPPPAPDWRSVLAGSQSTQRLKIAMPMLVSDHTRDMQWFKKGVDLSKLLVNCKETSRLESPALDDLSDILEQCERDANSTITEIENARVETTMEVLKILRYCSCDTWTREDMQDIVERDLKPAKVLR